MTTAPRPIPIQDGDDLSQQYTADALHALDADLATAEGSMLGHFVDPGAHPQINSRFAPASHAADEARHIGTGELAIPTPPATGRFHLEAIDGAVSWVPFP